MAADFETDSHLEIAHVLFIDIVGYSKGLTDEQRQRLQELNRIVRSTDQFCSAEAAGKLVRLTTGDGMALAFFTSPDAPVRCALQIARALRNRPDLPLRMGIHSGPVESVSDVNDRPNIAGAGINIAQRVMDCGDAGHILLSKRAADDLAQYMEWRPRLHELGEAEVKHGVRIAITNLWFDGFGNPALPQKLKRAALISRRRRLLWTALGLLLLLGGIGGWRWFNRGRPSSAQIPALLEKSIAVLPFENLGGGQENTYFADGVQEDILTNLAKIADLKVISRRSVSQYRGGTQRAREIGQALQVAYVLEGTVGRAGDKVRVTAQLIDTRTEAEKWAEKFERQLADVFAIQNEISEAIADRLKAVLTPEEKTVIETAPTKDMEAYDFYLRARALANAFGVIIRVRHENLLKAEPLLQAAVARDPRFALAYCLLAEVQWSDQWQRPPPERIAQARANLETALKLAPESGEVHLQLGLFYNEIDNDKKRAEEEFRIAARKLPNSVVVLRALAEFEKSRGQWKEALQHSHRAAELDPQNPDAALGLAEVYGALRRYPEADKVLDNAIAFLPHESTAFLWSEKAEQAAARGDTKAAMAAFDAHPFRNAGVAGVNRRRANILVLERRYGEAAALLSSLEEIGRTHNTFAGKNISYQRGEWELELAIIARAQGQKEKAKAAFEAARKDFSDWLVQSPEEPKALGYVAICDAGLGNKEEALREGHNAEQLWPSSRDYHSSLQVAKQLALVYAWTGDHEAAITQLQELAPLPDCLSYGELKLHPQWDDLRNEPAFDQLLLEVNKPAKID
jgi:TolB-like protein/Flp pilus assembly protein TadD